MARPLRVDVENGWYLVTARGIERRTIFYDDRYCEHFCELLAEMSERYSLGVHAHVLLGNHYHLILRTPNANLSRAMQWLNVSFSAWFNAKRNRVGHVFQGRFGSRLIDGDGSWLINASVTDRLIIGGTAFVEEMKSKIRVVSTEHPHRRWLQPKVSMSEIVRAVEGVKGEKWEEFRNRRGDWGSRWYCIWPGNGAAAVCESWANGWEGRSTKRFPRLWSGLRGSWRVIRSWRGV